MRAAGCKGLHRLPGFSPLVQTGSVAWANKALTLASVPSPTSTIARSKFYSNMQRNQDCTLPMTACGLAVIAFFQRKTRTANRDKEYRGDARKLPH